MTTDDHAPTSPRPLRRRLLPAALLSVVALGVSACAGQDPIPPIDGGDGTGDGTATTLPTTDEGLAYDARVLQSADNEITSIPDGTEGLTLEDVRMLQASTIDQLVPAPELVVGIEPSTADDEAWRTWALGDGFMTRADFEDDLETLTDDETISMDVRDEEDQETFEVLDRWELSVEDATATALPLVPGEVLAILPPEEPATLVFVVIREEDGTITRVALDSVTGEPINAVVVEQDSTDGGSPDDDGTDGDSADDHDGDADLSDIPPPCSCEDPSSDGPDSTGTLA